VCSECYCYWYPSLFFAHDVCHHIGPVVGTCGNCPAMERAGNVSGSQLAVYACAGMDVGAFLRYRNPWWTSLIWIFFHELELSMESIWRRGDLVQSDSSRTKPGKRKL